METEAQTEEITEEKLPRTLKAGLIALPLLIGSMIGINVYFQYKFGREPNPPRYEDRNGDGIEDKVVEKRWRHPGVLWGVDSTKEEILYGTGTELNGKKLYLPKEFFEDYMNRNSEQR